jgi:hypothetical protein
MQGPINLHNHVVLWQQDINLIEVIDHDLVLNFSHLTQKFGDEKLWVTRVVINALSYHNLILHDFWLQFFHQFCVVWVIVKPISGVQNLIHFAPFFSRKWFNTICVNDLVHDRFEMLSQRVRLRKANSRMQEWKATVNIEILLF